VELLLARTSKEAHLHMDLHPCRCGDRTRPADSAVLDLDGALASRYSGTCPSCGTQREFLFRLPDELPAPRPGTVVFGAGGPSELLDPGEWLWVADRYAAAAPADATRLGPDGAREARRAVAYAEAAMGEVLAFVPAGADAVPPEAFRSDRGRTVYGAEPGRFSRVRLEVVRQTYREILVEIDALAL
jgi:hypothetical protein